MTQDKNEFKKQSRPAYSPSEDLAKLLGARVLGVAIKHIKTSIQDLQGPCLLLVTLDNGTVLIFKNGDGRLCTTGGLCQGGWQSALNYLNDHTELAHYACLEAWGPDNSELHVVRGSKQY